ncbi:DUF3037 domain-containing protein [Bizionia argentinensis JUB59]|uniref:DUF3037 domain-containing protein n=1 Tax=Bizionia argentinensis JUB59 TaxID=1046627 RepID=G2EG61_9FLAO|nr:DUF3037 domain-containing protein [Bizionia argentinensis]EGV42554.1 DUF3037 domain-containing protein [Bizionia argentinensis JUB59]
MPDKVTFEYAIIRFVPKVERDEFFNIGVILFSKRKKFLGIKYLIDPKKFDAFSNDIELYDVENYLKAWDLVCQGAPAGGKIGALELSDRFRWLAASKSTILQCSKTHPGLCYNPKETLEGLFESFVL